MVLQPLDHFDVSSTHSCQVFEVMGSDLQTHKEAQDCLRLSMPTVQSILRHLALGLDYLWKCGVAHGGKLSILHLYRLAENSALDLYARNVLFTLSLPGTTSEEQVMSCLGSPRIGSVKRTDGLSLEPSVPPYLVDFSSFYGNETRIKIVDFGNGNHWTTECFLLQY